MPERIEVVHLPPSSKDSGHHFPHDQRHVETVMDGDMIIRKEWWWEPKSRHCSKRHRPHARS